LTEILAPYGVTDEDYLVMLAQALQSRPRPGAAALSAAEREVLSRWAGLEVPAEEPGDAGRASVDQPTANLAAQFRDSLSAAEAGTLLGISASRVRHRVGEGALYAFKAGKQLRLPRWQFHQGGTLPGLPKVLAALEPTLHPLEVAGFMTATDDNLRIAEEPVTPRTWLIGGGDPAVVAHLVALVGAGW